MLRSVLSKEKCMNCKNCCVFYNESRWEMPAVSENDAKKICGFLNDPEAVMKTGKSFKMHSVLRNIGFNGKNEEYRCSALDENSGCRLPEHLKPAECSMWPLRVMNDNGKIFISLASSCHGVDEQFRENVMKLLTYSLKEKIVDLINENKTIIKKYDNSYFKLIDITEEINE